MPRSLPDVRAWRLGLCCLYADGALPFRTTTAKAMGALSRPAQLAHLGRLVRLNSLSLLAAIARAPTLGIGAFRLTSDLAPLVTHPHLGYRIEQLPGAREITALLEQAGQVARTAGVRLSLHPDQFVVLSSMRPEVVRASLREMAWHGELAERVGVEQLTLHGGTALPSLPEAVSRLRAAVAQLSEAARQRLVFENDDRVWTPRMLLPVCEEAGIPFVYDVHHHRCHADGLSEEEATDRAVATWAGREPWMHLSSPRTPWGQGDDRPHADTIRLADLPAAWSGRRLTIDVESKGRDVAIGALVRLRQRQVAAAGAQPAGRPDA